MSGYETLIFEDGPKHAVITLNRPQVGNRINVRMVRNLLDVAHRIEDESKASVVILRGAGRSFCEGIDFRDFDPDKELDIHGFSKWEKVCSAYEKLNRITVALVHGECVGGGLQLPLVCDARLVRRGAQLWFNEVKMGFIPGLATFRLAKFVGLGRAKYFVLTGRKISAEEALAVGLADKIFDADDEERSLLETVEEFFPFNPDSLELSRRLLNESFAVEYEDFLGHFLAAQHRAISGEEFRRHIRKAHEDDKQR